MQAPTGTLALVFTDVQGSTALWEADPAIMQAALTLHNQQLRALIAAHRGYEVKTEGDAFMVAFANAADAVRWCVAGQTALFEADWPAGLAALPEAVTTPAHRGLRVRMGGHLGTPTCERDPVTGRMDYFGPMVNRSARIGAAGHGGQIVLSQALVDAAGPLDSVVTTGLGSHALKGLRQPERLVEVAAAHGPARSFPPLRTLSTKRRPLPPEPGTLLGRTPELDAVFAGWDEGARTLTLLGPGGAGKTRLALHVAHTVEREGAPAGGTWWVDLVPCRSAADVVRTIGDTLGIPLPPTGDDAARQAALVQALVERDHVLVVLDNAEHVLDRVRSLVAAVEAVAPRAWFLVTSRTPLRTAHERVVPVGALDVEAGVALLAARARRADPRFSLGEDDALTARALVRQLEGWPLAIELAGARLPAFGVPALLARLGASLDVLSGGELRRDGREATVEATLAWSWDLLDTDAQAALCRLTVFKGAFDIADAEHVLGPRASPLLDALRDQSLLHVRADDDEPRLRLTVSVRAFARARRERVLGAAAWADAVRAHAAWAARWGVLGVHWTNVALQAPDLYGSLPHHRSDIQAAWRAARADADAALVVPLALALGFLHVRWGPFTDGIPPLEEALTLPVLPGRSAVDLRVMLVLLLTRSGRPEQALPLLDDALRLASTGPDRARVLLSKAMVERATGRIEAAGVSLEAARAALGEADAPGVAGHIENTAGILASHHARYDEGEACYERAMAHYAAAGLRREQGMVALNHAGDLATRGRIDEGRALMARSVTFARAGEDLRLLAYALGNQGLLEARHGSLAEAWERLVEAEQVHRRIGDVNGIGAARMHQGFVLMAEDRWDEADAALAEALARFAETGNRYWAAVSNLDVARIRLRQGDPDGAAAAVDAADDFFAGNNDPGGVARVAYLRARVAQARGEDAAAALEAAHAACMRHEQALETAESLLWLGRVANDPRDAVTRFRAAMDRADRTSLAEVWCDAALELAARLPDWSERVDLLRRAAERARRTHHASRESAARAALAAALLDDGAVAEADLELREAARLSAALGDRGRVGRVRVSQARLALVRGAADDALAYASQAREDAVAGSTPVTEVEAWSLRAQARRARGEPGWRADADVARVRARAAGVASHPAVARALAAAFSA